MIRLPRLFVLARGHRSRPAPTRADTLRCSLDASLARRRQGRAERQATAVEREAAKHHAAFINDPIIRALRPDAIPNGEK